MAAPITLMGSVHITHPGAIDRQHGEESRAYLFVQVGKAAKGREIPLTERELIGLVASGAQALETLRKQREGGL